ncbi:MAG: carboxylating nicotinate-nucleotide diphosphorylase [Vampirovibrionales bacterium]
MLLPPSSLQLEPILKHFLLEDLSHGDLTVDALLGHYAGYDPTHLCSIPHIQGTMVLKTSGVFSGTWMIPTLLHLVDPRLSWTPSVAWLSLHQNPHAIGRAPYIALTQGEPFPLGILTGPSDAVLKIERTLLNLCQHLSGIASQTYLFASQIAHTHCRIVHTRKTTPGLRLLEREAVLDGGGSWHRYHLGQAAMIKDNHVSLAHHIATSLPELVTKIQARLSHMARLEVEVDTWEQFRAVMDETEAEVILLDNFTPLQCREAVRYAQTLHAKAGRHVVLEASGGITLDTVKAFAETGVDLISTSQITLGAPALDIGLDVCFKAQH